MQTYSSGMYVRLGFAVAAQLNPDIFLIDELLAVGDTAFRMKCFQHLLDIKNAGKTIVVVSHNMIDINRVCDRVMVMDTGMKIYEGDVSSGIATYEDLLLNQGVLADQRLPEAPAWIARVDLIDSQRYRRALDCARYDPNPRNAWSVFLPARRIQLRYYPAGNGRTVFDACLALACGQLQPAT